MSKDPLAFARRHPEWVVIKIGRSSYRWIVCSHCRQFFWLRLSVQTPIRIRTTSAGAEKRSVYCSDSCSRLAAQRLANERQKRWQANYKAKHGFDYYKHRRINSE